VHKEKKEKIIRRKHKTLEDEKKRKEKKIKEKSNLSIKF
jgi:hypothetical protein